MSDDTRERARQVAHGNSGCSLYSHPEPHTHVCDAVTDALLAFADAEVAADREASRKAHEAFQASLNHANEGRK